MRALRGAVLGGRRMADLRAGAQGMKRPDAQGMRGPNMPLTQKSLQFLTINSQH
jgi:hypothetical protein